MKTSTSRDSSVKHSTGNNDTLIKANRRRRSRPRTSTGKKAVVTHVTGKLFDLKREQQTQEEKPTKQKRPQAA